MSDDLERWLQSRPVAPAPVELRARVLAAVHREFDRVVIPRWERTARWAVAAGLIVGVSLNAYVARLNVDRMAQLYGPPLPPAEIAEMVAAVSAGDVAAGRALEARLLSARPSFRAPSSISSEQNYRQMIRQLQNNG